MQKAQAQQVDLKKLGTIRDGEYTYWVDMQSRRTRGDLVGFNALVMKDVKTYIAYTLIVDCRRGNFAVVQIYASVEGMGSRYYRPGLTVAPVPRPSPIQRMLEAVCHVQPPGVLEA